MTPKRAPCDGSVGVSRMLASDEGGDRVLVTVTTNGEDQTICMSPFNAARVLSALSLVLDLPLSKAAQKAIRL